MQPRPGLVQPELLGPLPHSAEPELCICFCKKVEAGKAQSGGQGIPPSNVKSTCHQFSEGAEVSPPEDFLQLVQQMRAKDFGECDRSYGASCALWQHIGLLLLAGPVNVTGIPEMLELLEVFNVTLNGVNLTLEERSGNHQEQLYIAESNCEKPSSFALSPRRLNDGAVSANFELQAPAVAGSFVVCWTRVGQIPQKMGEGFARESRDCILAGWELAAPSIDYQHLTSDGQACSRSCGGGLYEMRRNVLAQAVGGGVKCPGAASPERSRFFSCNTQPCPTALALNAYTEPNWVKPNTFFQVIVEGYFLKPEEDRVVLVQGGEAVECGQAANFSGGYGSAGNASEILGTAPGLMSRNGSIPQVQWGSGATCSQPISNSTYLQCGDGVASLVVNQPGRYRLCVCHAASVQVEYVNISGSMELVRDRCSRLEDFALMPSNGSLIDITGSHTDTEDRDSWREDKELGSFARDEAGVSPVVKKEQAVHKKIKKEPGESADVDDALGVLGMKGLQESGRNRSDLILILGLISATLLYCCAILGACWFWRWRWRKRGEWRRMGSGLFKNSLVAKATKAAWEAYNRTVTEQAQLTEDPYGENGDDLVAEPLADLTSGTLTPPGTGVSLKSGSSMHSSSTSSTRATTPGNHPSLCLHSWRFEFVPLQRLRSMDTLALWVTDAGSTAPAEPADVHRPVSPKMGGSFLDLPLAGKGTRSATASPSRPCTANTVLTIAEEPGWEGSSEVKQAQISAGSARQLGAKPESFGLRFLRLVNVQGQALKDPTKSLQAVEIEEGSNLTAVAQEERTLSATAEAFALWYRGAHRIITWGDPDYGGDSAAVQDQITSVQQVKSTGSAFAAILADGSVVTWGDPDDGGDSSAVQDRLRNVQQVQSTKYAFAAILADGSVVTWGHPNHGGDSSAVQEKLRNVQQVQSNKYAFAAILADGSVVTWGHPKHGGDSSAVQEKLRNVQQVQSTGYAFAAILADGSVVTWGDPDHGGDSSAVQKNLRNVQQVQSKYVFAGILAVTWWGHPNHGGDSSAVQEKLRNVQRVQSNKYAFAAILEDGSVVTWGLPYYGGDSSTVQNQLWSVQQVQSNETAFAAILADGSVVTWGDPDHGGDSSAVQKKLRNVLQVQSNETAFAAILADGSVVTWGKTCHGGDSSAVQEKLRNVKRVQGTDSAFAAILADGSVVTWGDPGCGGDSGATPTATQASRMLELQLPGLEKKLAKLREEQSESETESPQSEALPAPRGVLAAAPPSMAPPSLPGLPQSEAAKAEASKSSPRPSEVPQAPSKPSLPSMSAMRRPLPPPPKLSKEAEVPEPIQEQPQSLQPTTPVAVPAVEEIGL
eukprot:s330_g3.t1